mmetsp:Transcript_26832/g.68980  ORF Transcript_26832/g.68980 Transcript_26832/m.68980 type:complete len:128 (-) Transcript_26832:1220-1603(-)
MCLATCFRLDLTCLPLSPSSESPSSISEVDMWHDTILAISHSCGTMGDLYRGGYCKNPIVVFRERRTRGEPAVCLIRVMEARILVTEIEGEASSSSCSSKYSSSMSIEAVEIEEQAEGYLQEWNDHA